MNIYNKPNEQEITQSEAIERDRNDNNAVVGDNDVDICSLPKLSNSFYETHIGLNPNERKNRLKDVIKEDPYSANNTIIKHAKCLQKGLEDIAKNVRSTDDKDYRKFRMRAFSISSNEVTQDLIGKHIDNEIIKRCFGYTNKASFLKTAIFNQIKNDLIELAEQLRQCEVPKR
ncbi:hypothetical protein [Helicobacter pylori]|uniref:hypothetical protein n=1 Tax=Helicobacter pylori TaxID=210 RepID=UPI0002BBF452|nr:hypothetical protein [Helicobacter pylori]